MGTNSELTADAKWLLDRTGEMPSFGPDRLDFDAAFVPVQLTWDPPKDDVPRSEGLPAWWLPRRRTPGLSLHTPHKTDRSECWGAVELAAAVAAFPAVGVCGGSGSGKTTLATWFARETARTFIEAADSRPFPVLARNGGEIGLLSQAVQRALTSGARAVTVIVDGLGWDEVEWTMLEEVVAQGGLSQARFLLFSTAQRPLRTAKTHVKWLYLDPLTSGRYLLPDGAAGGSASGTGLSSLGVRLTDAFGNSGRPEQTNQVWMIHEYLTKAFSALKAAEPHDWTGGEFLARVSFAAFDLHRQRRREFTWGQLQSALHRNNGAPGSQTDIDRLKPSGDIGSWLLAPYSVLGGVEYTSFSHDMIREGLVARGMAQFDDDELLSQWKDFALGPTKVRLGVSLLEYLLWDQAHGGAEPRWHTIARRIADEDDLTQCGLMMAAAYGVGLGRNSNAETDLGRRFARLRESKIALDQARIGAVAPNVPQSSASAPRRAGDANAGTKAVSALLGPKKSGTLTKALQSSSGEAFKKSVGAALQDKRLRERIAWPDLAPQLATEEDLLVDVLGGIGRLDQRKLMENIGRQGTRGISALKRALSDPTKKVLAAKAFGGILGGEALTTLSLLAVDPDWMVRREVALALGSRGDDVGDLVGQLSLDDAPSVSFSVVTSALRSQAAWATPFLADELRGAADAVKVAICLSLLDQSSEHLREPLEGLLTSPTDRVAAAAALCLGDIDVLADKGGTQVIAARFRMPEHEMRLNHTLSRDPAGDIEATIAWLGNKVLTYDLGLNRRPYSEAALEGRQATAIQLLLTLAEREDELAAVVRADDRALRTSDVAIADMINRRDAVFSDQVRAILGALGVPGVRLFTRTWLTLFRTTESTESLTRALLDMENVNLVAEALRVRLSEAHPTNVLEPTMIRAFKSFSSEYVLSGIAHLIRRGGLDPAGATEVAELALDVLARSDVNDLPAGDLLQLELLLAYLRTSEISEVPSGDNWGGLRYIVHLREIQALQDALDYGAAQAKLLETPTWVRNRTWLHWGERLSFLTGDFAEALAARKRLRPENAVASDMLSLGARAANILGEEPLALSLLGFSVGVDRTTLMLQAAVIRKDSTTAATCVAKLGSFMERDAYLRCLGWLSAGLAGEEVGPPNFEGLSSRDRDVLASEFRSSAYDGLDGIGDLLALLQGD